MTQHPELNPVVITGDVHRNYAYNIKADFSNPDSETIGTEYITTSITSFGNGTGITVYGGTAKSRIVGSTTTIGAMYAVRSRPNNSRPITVWSRLSRIQTHR